MIVSIVIVNWNNKNLTRNCIESIFASSGDKFKSGEYELIVIDNGSSDGSREYLRSIKECIKVIYNDSNIGYSPACNQGMKLASGKYVLLLGNDTLITNNSLEKCIEFMEKHADAGAAGCKLLNPDKSIQNNCKKFPGLKNAVFTYLSLDKFNNDYDMDWFTYDETREVEQISTTFLMVKNDLLKRMNYFNEDYRILYNDVDLCYRIYERGYKIYFVHTAEVIHFGSRSTKKAGLKIRKIMYSDIYRYYRNTSGIKAIILIPILFFRLMLVSAVKK
jgi:GT2 family glycosyltransferase